MRKLRGYVLPALYVVILMLVFGAVSLVSTLLKNSPSYLYTIGILDDSSLPVVQYGDQLPEVIIKPYGGENVEVAKYFYDMKATEERQEQSLIYYKNTYMKNTGILYTSPEEFDVVMVLDGKIINIKEDDILGNYVEVEYNNDLRFVYYSLDEVDVKVGDELSQGEVIGKSGANNISDAENSLLFEVYYKGTLINPEDFYSMDITNIN